MESLIVTSSDLRRLVDSIGLTDFMRAIIQRVESYLSLYSDSQFEMPARAGFVQSDNDCPSALEWMPVLRRHHDVALKIVGYNPLSPTSRGLPTVVAHSAIFDSRTGGLKVLCDGTFLTALRTGAASAIASRHLAREDSRVLGLIGCGAQAVTQLHALSLFFPLAKVLYFDVDPVAMASFPARVARFGLPLQPSSADLIAESSDILCTATSVLPGAGPVFPFVETRPWLHINAVGSDLPGKVEVPLKHLQRSFVVPDFADQALREGECQQLGPELIGPELHHIVKAPAAYSKYRSLSTVFDSTGIALEDLAALEVTAEFATEYGIGEKVMLSTAATDPLDPYEFLSTVEDEYAREETRLHELLDGGERLP